MRSSIYLFVILSILSILTGSLHAANGDMGLSTQPLTDGSADYPYLIEDFDDFQEFASDGNSDIYWTGGGHTKLMVDIDLSGRTYKMAPISPDPTSNNLYEFDGIPYAGIFDGNDHTISNLTINSTGTPNDYLALFGMIANSGRVTNLELSADINADIYSCYNGAVCAVNAGYIENCATSGTLVNNKQDTMAYSNDSTGGICGKNSGSIVSCSSSMAIRGNSWYFGGICGYNDFGTISNCYAASSVSGGSNSKYLGGLCGYNDSGTINNSYAAGSVSGSSFLGGLCGYNDSGTITYCYSTGSVSGGSSLGGLCGYNNSGTISNSYFHIYAGPDNGIGIPLDDTQLQDKSSFAGFDFYGDSADGTDDIWAIAPGFMPRLYWQDSLGMEPPMLLDNINTTLNGTGYSNDPFIIYDYDDLMEFRNNSSLRIGYYSLASDIDIAGTTYSEAFIPELFIGDFDGDGHSISNLSINGTSYLGFFSKVSGKVSNLNIEHVNIIASGDYCGGLCGINYYGTITNCYATSSVSGGSDSYRLGGLCGSNYGTISNCYAAGSVSGDYFLGGICGVNTGDITNCYATSSVSGDDYLGGLCGGNSGDITNCYAAGSVSGGSDSYYLGGLCGQNGSGTISNSYFYIYTGPDNGIGIPLDDTQLQDKTSFVGFDFYGDSADGTDDIWAIAPGYMPVLSWQDSLGMEPPMLLDNINTTLNGTGYSNDPFIIYDYDDLMEFRNNSSLRIGYYSLASDIDLAGTTYSEAFIPELFIGDFDGNGYSIANLSINGTSNLGFFSELLGKVSNLNIEDVNIIASGDYCGGLCGGNSGDITNCYATGSVSGDDRLGGLCGYNDYGTITNCYTTGSVSGGSGSENLGGLCGGNSGDITNCYAAGSVSGGSSLGGLCGENNYGTITNCYAAGSVSGGSSLGGLCGGNSGDITNCYAASSVSGGSGSENLGGLCGYQYGNDANISNCFWDTQTSGMTIGYNLYSDSPGTITNVLGKTTSEMQNINTFLDASWDFVDETTNGTSEIWLMPELGGYPILSSLNDYMPVLLDGDGSQSNPYLISSAMELGAVYHYDSSAYYKLTADIELSGIQWSTAVIPLFDGHFDGDGYTIHNLTISGFEYLGMFGIIADSAEIFNIGLENVSITGSGDYLGGLCGSSSGTISSCYATGSVSGDYFLGGLCGENTGDITNSYAAGSVSGRSNSRYLGSICGVNSGDITNCYAASSVSGYDYLGGLCGGNFGDITNCYASGSVLGGIDSNYLGGLCGYQGGNNAKISNCFWDTQTSGLTVGYTQYSSSPDTTTNVLGKTTAQMQDINTFLAAGWDFTAESANGTDNLWHMPYQSTGYPMLFFQKDIPGDLAGSYGVDITDFAAISDSWLIDYNLSDLEILTNFWLEQ